MKRLLVCAGLLAASFVAVAQQTPAASPAKKPAASPAETATATIGGHAVTIDYSAPSVKGREGKLFGKDGRIAKDPHYPVWRAGANAATTLTTDGTLKIGDVSVPAGKYTLFVDISDPDNWVLIISKATGEWGLAYDASQDLGKTKMEMSKPSSMVEKLNYTIADGKITLAWEDHQASVPISGQ